MFYSDGKSDALEACRIMSEIPMETQMESDENLNFRRKQVPSEIPTSFRRNPSVPVSVSVGNLVGHFKGKQIWVFIFGEGVSVGAFECEERESEVRRERGRRRKREKGGDC